MPEITKAPRLETARLVLRAHRRDDFPDSAALWANPAVVRHITGKPSTSEESWSRLLRYAGLWSLLGFGYWLVEAKDDSRFIGEVGFADFQRDIVPSLEGRPEAGWVLSSSEHGKGYATEAVSRIVAWADSNIGADRTVCILDPQYGASINVARKAGYGDDAMATYRGQPTLVLSRPMR